MPVFNGEPFLTAAVESVLAQDYSDLELVIADNASTDHSLEIAERYAARDKRVRVLTSDRNRGAAWNYNRLVSATTGEYFQWAAADDVFRETYLSQCVEALDAEPDVVLVYARTIDIGPDGCELRHYGPMPHATASTAGVRFGQLIRQLKECFAAFGVIRRSSLDGTGLIGAYPSSDMVLLAELTLRGRFVELPDELFLHRQHEGRSMTKYARERSRAGWFDTAKADAIVMPRWRLLKEYVAGVRRAPLQATDRRHAYAAIPPWMWDNRVMLASNVVGATRDEVRRVLPRRRDDRDR